MGRGFSTDLHDMTDFAIMRNLNMLHLIKPFIRPPQGIVISIR